MINKNLSGGRFFLIEEGEFQLRGVILTEEGVSNGERKHFDGGRSISIKE